MSDRTDTSYAASVTEIWRYPVKSMLGERLDQVEIGRQGLPGDRCWAVRDEERGGIRGAKRFPALMQLAARFDEAPSASGSSPATITFPDGEELETGSDAVADRLSSFLGSPVTFWPLVSPDQLDHYRRGAPGSTDMEVELRATFGRTPDEPLPDLSKFPPELFEFESPVGTYFDAFPILLMTRKSLATVASAAPSSDVDVRRFRPNLLLETAPSADPFPELRWVGKRLRLGEAILEVELPCPRCVMTTHGFADLEKDPTIMRTLVKEAGGDLGVYASVVEPGTVSLGDELEMI